MPIGRPQLTTCPLVRIPNPMPWSESVLISANQWFNCRFKPALDSRLHRPSPPVASGAMATSPPVRRQSPDSPPDGFASTEWSLVLAASAEGGPALDRLCRAYWRPAYVYIRATGVARNEAEDATQEFFADLLRRDWLKLVDRERGSFRGFLRVSVRQFLNNRHRRAHAQKRGSGDLPIPLETDTCERELAQRSDRNDPAALYDESWANCVLQAALARLHAEQSKAGNADRFAQLRPYLTSPPSPGDYARIAENFAAPPGQIALQVHRLTQRFAEMIRGEIAATLADRGDVETELRYLLRLVAHRA
jgi:DNA-directed RNA polymerase specialized sigma24 family protein